jgi:hypothetical protein
MCARVWGPDPQPVFDVDADVTPQIRASVDSANPAATLRDLFEWVSADARRRFLMQVHTRAEDLDVLVERFQHTVRSEWANRYMRGDPDEQWVRLRRVTRWPWWFAVVPTALLLSAVGYWR